MSSYREQRLFRTQGTQQQQRPDGRWPLELIAWGEGWRINTSINETISDGASLSRGTQQSPTDQLTAAETFSLASLTPRPEIGNPSRQPPPTIFGKSESLPVSELRGVVHSQSPRSLEASFLPTGPHLWVWAYTGCGDVSTHILKAINPNRICHPRLPASA